MIRQAEWSSKEELERKIGEVKLRLDMPITNNERIYYRNVLRGYERRLENGEYSD